MIRINVMTNDLRNVLKSRRWRANNLEKHSLTQTAWASKNKDKRKAIVGRWKDSDPEGWDRVQRRKSRKYKVTHPENFTSEARQPLHVKDRLGIGAYEHFNAQMNIQKNRCAICHTHIEFKGKTSGHRDHNHETRQLRGVLCNRCNVGFGMFRESVEILNAAIDYKKKWEDVNA
jgi:hypothetical protein